MPLQWRPVTAGSTRFSKAAGYAGGYLLFKRRLLLKGGKLLEDIKIKESHAVPKMMEQARRMPKDLSRKSLLAAKKTKEQMAQAAESRAAGQAVVNTT